jgi:hypothetical protein
MKKGGDRCKAGCLGEDKANKCSRRGTKGFSANGGAALPLVFKWASIVTAVMY